MTMISKDLEQTCYVYIALPGQTNLTTAGRFILSMHRDGTTIGKFYYGKKYLANPNAVAIDPVELKFDDKTYTTTALNGVFGALRDASPDYWGRQIIERNYGKAILSEMDYLLNAPDDRAGALGFGLNKIPPAPKQVFNQTIDFEKLQRIADSIIKQEEMPYDPDTQQIADLMLLETSIGGARPKATIEDAEGLWIAKFNRFDDRWNQARVEHAMLSLARECGLRVAESKVKNIGKRDVLLVKRFDRDKIEGGYLRARMISALTLIKAEDSHRSRDKWSYVILAEELRRVSAEPLKDANELFKRMCFNALISNTDDHPRNHALIAKKDEWRLSPAFDLTPSLPISIERRDLALTCGDMGRFANETNLLSQHARFCLDEEQAKTIIKNMSECISSKWFSIARNVGVSETDCTTIASAFVYPGFWQH